ESHAAAGKTSGRRAHPDFGIAHPHHLAGADLGGLAQLHRAIDPHRAARHQLLAGAAGIAQPGQLQQLVEFDEIAIEVEVDGLHGRQGREMRARWPLRSITTPPRSIATTPRSPMRSPSAMRWPSRMTKRRAGDGSHMCMLSRTGGRPLASMSATSV